MAYRFTPGEVTAYCAVRMPQLGKGGTERRGPCPLHHGARDSFSINIENGLWTCHACGRGGDLIKLECELTGAYPRDAVQEVLRIVGRADITDRHARRTKSVIAAEYDYCDESGQLVYQTIRYDPKDFKQRQPDGKGGWQWNLKGVRLVLYHLPELLKRGSETVYVCEGEKDVLALESLGLLATCNPMGAGKWRDEYAESVRGRRLVVFTENDPPADASGKPHYKGQRHAAVVAESLIAHDCEVRIIEPPRGKDVSDWVADGATRREIEDLAQEMAVLTPGALIEWTKRWVGPLPDADDWPEPIPLQSELPAVKPFSIDLMPSSFRPFVRESAERMQVPSDYAGVVAILCLAGVVSRRASIQPKANDSGWIVTPNLWGAIIAPPGYLKSPVIQAATRPLNQIQKLWWEEHKEALKTYSDAKEEFDLRHSAWKESFKSCLKKNKVPPEKSTDAPVEPMLRRLIVNDCTFESLHQMMSENPAGVILVRDELTGWLASLDRSGREGERAFCLQAWNGDTGHTIDRIARGTIHVEACCMSLLGGIQPARLRTYLVDSLHDGPGNDGLIQRFQVIVWPNTEREWKYVDRRPDPAIEEQIMRVFRVLVELDCENPLRFRFAPPGTGIVHRVAV